MGLTWHIIKHGRESSQQCWGPPRFAVTQIVGPGNHTDLRACLSVLCQAHRGEGSRAKKPEEPISLSNLHELSAVQPKLQSAIKGAPMLSCQDWSLTKYTPGS